MEDLENVFVEPFENDVFIGGVFVDNVVMGVVMDENAIAPQYTSVWIIAGIIITLIGLLHLQSDDITVNIQFCTYIIFCIIHIASEF
jgi:hypothetical protein